MRANLLILQSSENHRSFDNFSGIEINRFCSIRFISNRNLATIPKRHYTIIFFVTKNLNWKLREINFGGKHLRVESLETLWNMFKVKKWCHSDVFIVNFRHMLHFFYYIFHFLLLLTLNRYTFAGFVLILVLNWIA